MVFKTIAGFFFLRGALPRIYCIHASPTELPSNIGKKCNPNSEIYDVLPHAAFVG